MNSSVAPVASSWSSVGSPLRWAVALAATVSAVAHIPPTPEHLVEAPYMGVGFIAFTLTCLAIAATTLVRDSAVVYRAAAAVCGAGIATYAATRLIAFPLLSDDVGNWLEPLGVVSVLAEAIVVLGSLRALSSRELSRRC